MQRDARTYSSPDPLGLQRLERRRKDMMIFTSRVQILLSGTVLQMKPHTLRPRVAAGVAAMALKRTRVVKSHMR
jgi:hypothetical protein